MVQKARVCVHIQCGKTVDPGKERTVCFVLGFKVFRGLENFQDKNQRIFMQFRNRLQKDPLVPGGKVHPLEHSHLGIRFSASKRAPQWTAVGSGPAMAKCAEMASSCPHDLYHSRDHARAAEQEPSGCREPI